MSIFVLTSLLNESTSVLGHVLQEASITRVCNFNPVASRLAGQLPQATNSVNVHTRQCHRLSQ